MNYYIKGIAPLIFATVLLASSCTEAKTGSIEETEINTMDSTSKLLEVNREKLEDQTNKVEESVEKLDADLIHQRSLENGRPFLPDKLLLSDPLF